MPEEARDPLYWSRFKIQKHNSPEQSPIKIKTPLIRKIEKGGYCWVERSKAWLTLI